MDKLKVGIMGGGGIVGAHVQGYDRVKELCEVAAVAEPNAARHETIRKWFGDKVRIVPDYHELLGLKEIQAVDICLPHSLHLPATAAAAEAGKHVLVEKVMARNVWECDRMIEACDKHGVSLSVCHDRHLNSNWVALKEVVDSGVLGEIFLLKLDHNQNVAVPPGHWIANFDEVGGGAIMSCLTHQLDALRWYGGEPEAVNCMCKTIPERMEGEFLGLMSARMKSGALAQLSINWWTRPNSSKDGLWYEMVQICGTKGEAYYMAGRGSFVKIHDKDEDFVEVCNTPHDGHANLVGEWVKGLLGMTARAVPDGRSARGAVELAEAAYLAAAAKAEVKFPVVPTPWADRSDPAMVARQFARNAPQTVKEKINPANPLAAK